MTPVAVEQPQFHPHSFADPAGRLFSWEGGLYRAIQPAWEDHLRALLREPVVGALMADRLLVPTSIERMSLPGYTLVLRHTRLPFPSYAEEWSPPMLKDAALAVLAVAQRLSQAGLMLKDGHCWNVLFDGVRPCYVDLPSIVSADGATHWPARDEFERFFLHPLLLMARGQDRVARRLLPHGEGVLAADLSALPEYSRLWQRLQRGARRVGAGLRRGRSTLRAQRGPTSDGRRSGQRPAVAVSLLRELRDLESRVRSIKVTPSIASGRVWAGSPRVTRVRALDADTFAICQRLRPATIGVIEGEAATVAAYARHTGIAAISFRGDLRRASDEYEVMRVGGEPMLPLLLDFTDPTPARGIDSHSTVAATERLRADLVVGPNRLPDVARARYLRPELVVRGLSLMARRWLVLPNLPRDAAIARRPRGTDDGWHLAALLPALQAEFSRVESVERADRAGLLVVCER